MTKPVVNPSAGAKSSGKFTFSVISPDKEAAAVSYFLFFIWCLNLLFNYSYLSDWLGIMDLLRLNHK